MRLLTLAVALSTLTGCGGRVRKFFAPDAWVLPEGPTGTAARVRYDSGYRDDPPRTWSPQPFDGPGGPWVQPITVTSRGWLEVDPLLADARVRLFLRHQGLVPHDFEEIHTVTGGLRRAVPNEIRPLPTRLEHPWRLPLAQLHNVYNGYDFQDGDLLLVEVDAPGAPPEHYLFRTRKLGLRSKAGVGLLVRVPLPGGGDASVSPAFAATLAMGYRPRTRNPTLAWAGDKLGLVASLGVGSTAVDLGDDDVDAQLTSVLNAALAGGGIELYDVLSVQVLANLSSLGRERNEETATLAIGFDAVQFGRFTREAGIRLFSPNTLDED